MKKGLLLLLLPTLISCGSSTPATSRNPINNGNSSEALADCSGFQSDMLVPFGILTPTGQALAGKKFAKIVAVDSKDGRMKVTIVPPDNQSDFTTQKALLDELSQQGYTLRIIACRENPLSVVSGSSTTGVCSSRGQKNKIGKDTITSADFFPDGYTADGATVHATATAVSSLLKPDFIMITASLLDQDDIGGIIVAYRVSPYYNGCYSK